MTNPQADCQVIPLNVFMQLPDLIYRKKPTIWEQYVTEPNNKPGTFKSIFFLSRTWQLSSLYALENNLTLKAPRKTASENVVCLCRLLNILADFSNLFLHTGKQCGPRSDCS